MKSAEEILRTHSTVCPKFPDPTCGSGCMCNADLAAIRAAQIDAAEWMREEAAKVVSSDRFYPVSRPRHASLILSIKLPGNDAEPI